MASWRDFLPLPFAQPAKPPLGEQVAADTRIGAFGRTFIRYNPDEIVGRKGLRVYDEMLRDEQVKACLGLKKAALIGPGWRLQPSVEKDDGAQEFADKISEVLDNVEGTFEDALMSILMALNHGFSITEPVWGVGGDLGVFYQALKGRAPHDIDFEQDDYGNILKIRQTAWNGKEIDRNRIVLFQHEATFSNPYGTADLQSAHRSWFYKKNWLQWWAIWGEKLADQPVVLKTPTNATPAKVQAALNVFDHMSAKNTIAIPAEWEAELMESGRDPQAVFESAIDRHDIAISKALLVPDKLGFSGGAVEGGSYSLSKTQLGAFYFVLNMLRQRLESCVQEQIVDPLCEFVAPGVDKPLFTILPPDEDDKFAVADAVSKLVAGQALGWDLEDENQLRQKLGFSEVDEQREQRREEAAQRKMEQMQVPADAPVGDKQKPKQDQPTVHSESADGLPVTCSVREFARPLTPLEERTDMAEKAATYDTLTPEMATMLSEATAAIIDDLKAKVTRKGLGDKPDPKLIRTLKPSARLVNALRKGVQEHMQRGFDVAKGQAAAEVERARGDKPAE